MRATRWRLNIDHWLLAAVLFLAAWGLLMVYSSSSALALARQNGNDLFYVQSQLVRCLLGVGLLLALSRLDVRLLAGRIGWGVWAGLMLLLLILFLPSGPGVEVRGATRWMRIGRSIFQPSEFARLAMILLLAGVLTRLGTRLQTWRGVLLPAGIVFATAGLIAAEPHLSLAMLTAVGGFLLIFAAGASAWRLLVIGGGGVVVAAAVALIKGGGYHHDRWEGFLAGIHGEMAYQAKQSVLAIGSGGLFGQGIGDGLQKYFFLPDPHTDFILSIIVEELGFLGLLALFLLIGFILVRIFAIGSRSISPFGGLLCVGVGLQMLLAFLLHAAVCLGWAPITGVPFPLISFGGSALVTNLIGLGLVLSVSGLRDHGLGGALPGRDRLWREPMIGRARR